MSQSDCLSIISVAFMPASASLLPPPSTLLMPPACMPVALCMQLCILPLTLPLACGLHAFELSCIPPASDTRALISYSAGCNEMLRGDTPHADLLFMRMRTGRHACGGRGGRAARCAGPAGAYPQPISCACACVAIGWVCACAVLQFIIPVLVGARL